MLGRELVPVFTLEDARQAGLSKDRIYSLLRQDKIECVGRGVSGPRSGDATSAAAPLHPRLGAVDRKSVV